eukprot:10623230-Alexandrium_andersonii.AAC.1
MAGFARELLAGWTCVSSGNSRLGGRSAPTQRTSRSLRIRPQRQEDPGIAGCLRARVLRIQCAFFGSARARVGNLRASIMVRSAAFRSRASATPSL